MFYFLFGVMLSAFFVIVVLAKVKAAVNDSSFYKRFYSRDLALLADSLHASNGNLSIDYTFYTPKNMWLDINLTKDRVILTDTSDLPLEDRAQTAFLFGYNDFVEVIPAGMNSYVIRFRVVNEDRKLAFKEATAFRLIEGGGGGAGGDAK